MGKNNASKCKHRQSQDKENNRGRTRQRRKPASPCLFQAPRGRMRTLLLCPLVRDNRTICAKALLLFRHPQKAELNALSLAVQISPNEASNVFFPPPTDIFLSLQATYEDHKQGDAHGSLPIKTHTRRNFPSKKIPADATTASHCLNIAASSNVPVTSSEIYSEGPL